jgi:hypothetical protein
VKRRQAAGPETTGLAKAFAGTESIEPAERTAAGPEGGAAVDLAVARGVSVCVSATGRSGGRLKSFGADTLSCSEVVAAVATSSLETDAVAWGAGIDLAAATRDCVCVSTSGPGEWLKSFGAGNWS